MKGNGPNSPQTVRGLLNRRSQRAILDTRAHQEADILMAPMAAPFGKGFHKLTTPAGTEYTVGDASGMTFAPNAQVMVANPGGLGHRAVLGKAPPNRNGGAARTRNPRRRGTVVLESNQYAFGYDVDSNLLAMLYADGAYVSTRATLAPFGENISGCILSDSSTLVGDGSPFMVGASAIYVWDVEGAATYTYSVPSGWVNPTAPYYHGGYLWWCEFEELPEAGVGVGDATFDYRLRRAATDLTGVTTVTTVTSANANSYGPPFTAYQSSPYPFAFAVDSDGAILYIGAQVTEIINHESILWVGVQARFPLAGGAPSLRDWTIDEFRDSLDTAPPGNGFACATLAAGSFAICNLYGSGHSVMSKSDDASADASDLWPTTSFDAGVSPASFNVGTGGAVLQVYGSGYILRGVGSGTEITNAVEAFDATPTYPTSMFYYGS